jgi:hypothetical protein
MWQGVRFSLLAEAAAACAATAIVVSILMQAILFHKFQKLTPNTWRQEDKRKYAIAMFARLILGVGFTMLYVYTGMGRSVRAEWLMIGLKFGGLGWLGVALPQTISMATFVNLNRGFVVGQLLDWLIVCLACGVICARLLQY